MDTLISSSVEETLALGHQWAVATRAGSVIGLTGDLGSGKTTLVRGLARGLGFAGRVHSPTFALVNIYEGGRWPLFHLDLYRLQTADDVIRAGLEEYLHPRSGLTVIEWAEKWFDPEPEPEAHCPPTTAALRRVWIEVTGDQCRTFRVADL